MLSARNMRGFSLIEILVYLALLTLLMTGALSSMYAITESTKRNKAEAVLELEGAFIMQRITSALQSAEVLEPEQAQTSARLRVERDSARYIFYKNSGFLYEDVSDDSSPLSTLPCAKVQFVRLGTKQSPTDPERIHISFELASNETGGPPLSREFERVLYLDGLW